MRSEGIKMSSGQSSEPQQQMPYPAYGMQYQPAHRPASDYVKSLASDMWLALGVVAGLFLLMLGSLIFGAETTNWSGTATAGMVVKALGLFVVTAAMFMGGILRADMNKWVRVALLLSATVLVVLVGFWGSFWPNLMGLF
jgi:hypothetical protein